MNSRYERIRHSTPTASLVPMTRFLGVKGGSKRSPDGIKWNPGKLVQTDLPWISLRCIQATLADYPHHIVQRGHNRQVVFAQEGDFAVYLSNLQELKVCSRAKALKCHSNLSPFLFRWAYVHYRDEDIPVARMQQIANQGHCKYIMINVTMNYGWIPCFWLRRFSDTDRLQWAFCGRGVNARTLQIN